PCHGSAALVGSLVRGEIGQARVGDELAARTPLLLLQSRAACWFNDFARRGTPLPPRFWLSVLASRQRRPRGDPPPCAHRRSRHLGDHNDARLTLWRWRLPWDCHDDPIPPRTTRGLPPGEQFTIETSMTAARRAGQF